jgi:Replicative DNA helicase
MRSIAIHRARRATLGGTRPIATIIGVENGRPPSNEIQKLSPQALEAEQSVLGSILIDADAILKVGDFLRPADFYRKQHGDIFEAMLALHGQREPIDLVTVGDELERRGRLEPIGGPAYLARLMNAVPTAVHVEHYGRIVERKAVLRNLIGAAGRIAAVGYEEANDAEVAIDRAEGILFEISQRRTVGGFESLATLLGQAYDRLEYLHEHRGQILGIPSGLSQLDTLLGGFQPSDLIILAARPSVGKTSLALNIAQHAAVREGKRVGVFSLEMSKAAVRLLSAESGINPRPLQTGFVDETDWSKIAQVMNQMHAAPMWIDDSPALSVMELRTKARRLEAEQHGLDLIIVDYLQLIRLHAVARWQPGAGGERDQPRHEAARPRTEGAGAGALPAVAWRRAAWQRRAAPLGPS